LLTALVLQTAETALAGYDAAVSERDYRLALSLAIDARQSADNARKHSVDEKARVRSSAEQLLGSIEKDVAAIEQRLNGKSGPRPSRPLATRLTAAVKNARTALQKARSRMAGEDYNGAIAILGPVREALDPLLDAQPAARGRAGR
jgi:hypothetical protein